MRAGLCILIGYLVGSVPTGMMLVRRLRPDVDLRRVGTGNLGTSNIFRNVGRGPAVVVGPVQFAQGLFPVLLGRWVGLDGAALAAVAVATVVGNAWPVWAGFDGGRGIAVATGAVAGLGYWGLAVLLAFYAAGLALAEIAIGVLAGFLVLPAVEVFAAGTAAGVAALAMLAVVLLRRLAGAHADLAGSHDRAAVLAGRLLRDQRTGRPLVGRRPDG
jgi:glycerol-3-phosphate acyltransferase PlsY